MNSKFKAPKTTCWTCHGTGREPDRSPQTALLCLTCAGVGSTDHLREIASRTKREKPPKQFGRSRFASSMHAC